MIRIKDIKIREDLSLEQIFQKAGSSAQLCNGVHSNANERFC